MVICICLLFVARNASGEISSPGDRIRSMLSEVMSVQNDPLLKGDAFVEKRRAAIQSIIARNFGFDTMSQAALGPQWEKLNHDQQLEFGNIFRDLFQDSYTRMVLNFLKQEKIVYVREDIQKDHAQIMTRIIRTNEEIPVDYSLSRIQNGWIVQDVKIDGVSIVQNYRRSFTRVILRQSYGVLLEKMRLQQQAIEKEN